MHHYRDRDACLWYNSCMKIYISHSGNYDYISRLYEPLRKSNLFVEHEIFLPHDNRNKTVKTKTIIEESDLIIAETSYPSTGQGIELGWANSHNKKILLVHKANTTPSGSLRFISEQNLTYSNQTELIDVLYEFIAG